MITYEYPLNERIRTLLRLEELFARQAHFARADSPHDHHAALLGLFEILEVASRADLKVDLVQELERQRQILLGRQIDDERVSGALYGIEQAAGALLAMNGKVGQYLRENDFLMGVRSRAQMPGGACLFDLPSYRNWLQHEAGQRRRDLEGWLRPLEPIREGIAIVLSLLRRGDSPELLLARHGIFQRTLGSRAAQMVRIRVSPGDQVVPETSANRYALCIRFVMADTAARPRPVSRDVGFELTFCSLAP